jgi:uncharacterized protein (TIGR02284 family)
MANPTTPQSGISGTSTPPGADNGNEVRSFSSDEGLGRTAQTDVSGRADTGDVIDVLNELIETSKDGEKGFALAAKDANDPVLTGIFSDGERSCREAARELQEQVRALGGDPDTGGSVKGAVHRGWVSLKAATTARDAKAVLEECERGEDYAKAKYAEALKHDLPPDVRQLIERQYRGVIENHDRVRDLRNQYRDR